MALKDKSTETVKEQIKGYSPGEEADHSDKSSSLALPIDYSLFTYAPFGVIITNESGEIEFANKRTETIFGYRSEDLRGNPIEVLIPENLRSSHIEYRSGFKDQPFSRPMGIGMNLLGRRKNGEVFPVEVGISYAYIQNKLHIFCYATDITQRIHYEEVLSKQNDFLSALHETSLLILSRLDLDQVLDTIVTKAITLLDCDHGEIYLLDREKGKIEPRSKVGTLGKDGENGDINLDNFIKQVIDSGQPVIENLSENNPPGKDSLLEKSKCLMGLPLESENEINGAICIIGGEETRKFTRDLAVEMLRYFGQLASIAIQNAQLFSEVEHQKARMERELDYARTVQVAMLPRKFPEVSSWSFAARWKPALEVAGDYYDFIIRDDNFFDMVVADVTDKGVPAALFMAYSKTLTRSSLELSESLLEGVTQANQEILQENAGPFVTMFLTRFNAATGEGYYVNAGHEPALLYRSDSDDLVELHQTGLPLGIDKELPYQELPIQLNCHDFIVMYTDGVSEAMNQEFKQFGKEAIIKTVQQYRHETAEEIAKHLLEEVEAFIGHKEPSDDLTILVARRDCQS